MDESSLKKSFGLRCRQLRDQTGLSQEKLALLINMDRSYYASIETGLRNVTLVHKHKHSLIVKGLVAPLVDHYSILIIHTCCNPTIIPNKPRATPDSICRRSPKCEQICR